MGRAPITGQMGSLQMMKVGTDGNRRNLLTASCRDSLAFWIRGQRCWARTRCRLLKFQSILIALVRWRQIGWLDGVLPSSAPLPTLREGVDVLLTGKEEIQKVDAHVFAGLANAQEDEVILDPFGCG